jgi:hypothetical protein
VIATPDELKSVFDGTPLRREADLNGHPAALYLGQIKNYAGAPIAVLEVIKDTTEYEAAATSSQRNLIWNIGQEGGRQASSMHGKGHMTRANDPWRATSNTAAHIKADEIATGIVRQWAADHPEALLEAHRETVRLEIAKIQVRIDELRGEIEAETAKTVALQERL